MRQFDRALRWASSGEMSGEIVEDVFTEIVMCIAVQADAQIVLEANGGSCIPHWVSKKTS
ncbi:hypothetical protein PQR68_07150 [Paraburkholderia agricolaris]|jgi:hypothetical protein|uniref:Uncharacterized protein n=1 Tax=Paraburkholderia agricolaris TaxID=2152888 RepID=A0ABW8ZEC0_9BURK|nr:hypothetical protein [Paraburkholderia agricolaris]